jgi:magnesium-transporting ATPase (P-type)
MRKPPRSREDRLLTRGLLIRAYLFLGAFEAIAAMAAFFLVLLGGGWQWGQALLPDDRLYRGATTACLTAIVIMQVVNVHLCRGRRRSLFSQSLFANGVITTGIVAEFVLILLIDYTPVGNALFGTAPITLRVWIFVLPFALAMFALEELRKGISRRRDAAVVVSPA